MLIFPIFFGCHVVSPKNRLRRAGSHPHPAVRPRHLPGLGPAATAAGGADEDRSQVSGV